MGPNPRRLDSSSRNGAATSCCRLAAASQRLKHDRPSCHIISINAFLSGPVNPISLANHPRHCGFHIGSGDAIITVIQMDRHRHKKKPLVMRAVLGSFLHRFLQPLLQQHRMGAFAVFTILRHDTAGQFPRETLSAPPDLAQGLFLHLEIPPVNYSSAIHVLSDATSLRGVIVPADPPRLELIPLWVAESLRYAGTRSPCLASTRSLECAPYDVYTF